MTDVLITQYQGALLLLSGSSAFMLMLLSLRLISLRSSKLTTKGNPQEEKWHKPEYLTIAETITESKDIKSFRLIRSTSDQPFPTYKGGQFLSFRLPHVNDAKTVRSYSISSPTMATDPYSLYISVKRIPGGVGSEWFHQAKVGEKILAYPPSGHFVDNYPCDLTRIYIAGGVGITPFISMLADSLSYPRYCDINLFYGSRKYEDLAFHDHLCLLEKRHQRFSYFPILSSTTQNHPSIDKGRITLEYITQKTSLSSWDHAVFFFCGPPAMSESIMELLKKRGVSEERMIYEKFISPTLLDPSTFDPVQTQVKFMGKEYLYNGKDNILSFLEDQGEVIPYACRSGVCGSCRLLIEGSYKALTDSGLTPHQRRKGWALSCVSYPKGGPLSIKSEENNE
ncbi:MAG: iron-sulfur cluster-binding domain-containing protein [Proteobacteria bacterium]|nr:iron-sulfur cluster-binding domain-containing protein [Pseudomonadota bacterium]